MNILNNGNCRLYTKLPIPIFIINRDITVYNCNPAALKLLNITDINEVTSEVTSELTGDVLSCINSSNKAGTCGCKDLCSKCDIRNSLNKTFNLMQDVTQLPTVIQIYRNGEIYKVNALITTFKFNKDTAMLIIENITEFVELRKLIPICSHCKKVRSDDNFWSNVEEFIERHEDCNVTSGICPDCISNLYPEFTKAQLEQLKDKY